MIVTMKKRVWLVSLMLSASVLLTAIWSPAVLQASDELTTQQKLERLIEMGFISTDGTGDLGLKGNITRAEFAFVLAKVTSSEVSSVGSGGEMLFSDIRSDEWYAGFVQAAAKAGLMVGVGEGRFEPDGELTLEQLAVIAVKVLNLKPSLDDSVNGEVSDWARAHVATALKSGLLPVTDDYTQPASQDDLVTSTFGMNACLTAPPVALSETVLDMQGEKGEMTLSFTAPILADSIDLKNFKLEGASLESVKDSYTLSPDGKKLTVILNKEATNYLKTLGLAGSQLYREIVIEGLAAQCKPDEQLPPMKSPLKETGLTPTPSPTPTPAPVEWNPPTSTPTNSSTSTPLPKPTISIGGTVSWQAVGDHYPYCDLFAKVTVNSKNASKLYYVVLPEGSEAPSADQILNPDLISRVVKSGSVDTSGSKELAIERLKLYEPPDFSMKSYELYVTGVKGDLKSEIRSTRIIGENSDILYSVELDRSSGEISINPSLQDLSPTEMYYAVTEQDINPTPDTIKELVESGNPPDVKQLGIVDLVGPVTMPKLINIESKTYYVYVVLEYKGILLLMHSESSPEDQT